MSPQTHGWPTQKQYVREPPKIQSEPPELARELKVPARTAGVVVTEVASGSKAAESGLRRGDVIQEVNRKPVENKEQFDAAMRRSGENPLLLVNRQGNTLFVAA